MRVKEHRKNTERKKDMFTAIFKLIASIVVPFEPNAWDDFAKIIFWLRGW